MISKNVSDNIGRLQKHQFHWGNESYKDLMLQYPKCMTSLKWWTSQHIIEKHEKMPDVPFKQSVFDIDNIKGLREFILLNPIKFTVSNKCCYYAKKKPSQSYEKAIGCDLKILGIRKAEGGIRSGIYKSCYTGYTSHGYALYMPLFWWTDADKRYYEKRFDIVHSDCYTVYGCKRTGCVGCPFNRNLFDELEKIKMYEPKLYKACTTMFAESYDYTARFREFQKQFIAEEKEQKKANKYYSLLGDSDDNLH